MRVHQKHPRFLPFVQIPIVLSLFDCDTIDDKWHAYRGLQTLFHSRDILNAYGRILAKQLYVPYIIKKNTLLYSHPYTYTLYVKKLHDSNLKNLKKLN